MAKSKYVVVSVVCAVFVIGFLIGWMISVFNLTSLSDITYVIERIKDGYQAVRGDGKVVCRDADASIVIQYAVDNLSEGGVIVIKEGIYEGSKDILVENKSRISIISRGATFNRRIIVRSTGNLEFGNEIAGLQFEGINAGIRLENVFYTKIRDCSFTSCNIGIELKNTKKWTEFTKIENVYFNDCRRSIVFKSPDSSAQTDYLNTMLDHVAIELRKTEDIGIEVEPNATVGDSIFSNLKIWFHKDNQIGILWNGIGNGTVIIKPTFESFVDNPQNLFAVELGNNISCAPYLIKPSFYGKLTARICNKNAKWVYALGGAFKNEVSSEKGEIAISTNGNYSTNATILENRLGTGLIDPHILIEVNGTFQEGEVITIRITFELLDNTRVDPPIELDFTSPAKHSLDEWEIYELLPSCNSISAIIASVKTNKQSTNVTVTIKAYAFG